MRASFGTGAAKSWRCRVRADRELKARAFKPLATDLEQKGEQVPGKMVTIYVGPQNAVGDRDDRGRSRIRERLSRQYALRRRMSRHEIDELWSGIHAQAPWMHEVVRWLWEQHLLRLGDEDGCFKVPPILICGRRVPGRPIFAA